MPGKSKLSNPHNPQKNIKQEFDFDVQEAQEKINFFNSEFPKLGQEFFSFMANKKLSLNKGPKENESETQLLQRLSMLSEQMNVDETQKESAGSMALLTVILIVLRDLRDRINNLEYKTKSEIELLKEKIQKLEVKNLT